MTRKLAQAAFFIYQGLFPSKNATCRYSPTCSQYAKEALFKYGLVKGTYLAVGRLLSCHPFSKRPMYDPA